MGLSLVRAAPKNCALGGILESKKQEQLISAIENKVQHALAPDGALSTSIRVQMTNVLGDCKEGVYAALTAAAGQGEAGVGPLCRDVVLGELLLDARLAGASCRPPSARFPGARRPAISRALNAAPCAVPLP